MKLYIFRCRGRRQTYGATRFETGSNLPGDRCAGGWDFYTLVDTNASGTPRLGVDFRTVRRGVQQEGWYVWDDLREPALRSTPAPAVSRPAPVESEPVTLEPVALPSTPAPIVASTPAPIVATPVPIVASTPAPAAAESRPPAPEIRPPAPAPPPTRPAVVESPPAPPPSKPASAGSKPAPSPSRPAPAESTPAPPPPTPAPAKSAPAPPPARPAPAESTPAPPPIKPAPAESRPAPQQMRPAPAAPAPVVPEVAATPAAAAGADVAPASTPGHQVVWFDIPVRDIDRAVRFYSAVLGTALTKQHAGPGMAMAMLAHVEGTIGGCLVQSMDAKPSDGGPLLYLNTQGRLDEAVSAVESHAGKVLAPRHSIGPFGFRAIVLDSEGNRIALHSM